MTMTRCSTWVELDLRRFEANIRLLRSALAGRSDLILVIKADAYGHGMEIVARQAYEAGIRHYVVARMEEALELRAILPEGIIYQIGSVWPGDVEALVANRIIPVLVDEDQACEVAAEARRRGVSLDCHIKIDTGMGRFGVPWEDAVDVMGRIRDAGGVEIRGICTHFAAVGQASRGFDEVQAERFRRVEQGCKAMGLVGLSRHVANSSVFLSHPEWDMDGVRLGITAYGYCDVSVGERVQTRPFMQWKTRVVQVKRVEAGFPVGYDSTHVTTSPTRLATIDVGYADGFSRLMSNCGHVLIGGRRAPVVGRVTMSYTMVDVGLEGEVKRGDEVVLMGQQGRESIWADELAQWCQTIPYEVLTNIQTHHSQVRQVCP